MLLLAIPIHCVFLFIYTNVIIEIKDAKYIVLLYLVAVICTELSLQWQRQRLMFGQFDHSLVYLVNAPDLDRSRVDKELYW